MTGKQQRLLGACLFCIALALHACRASVEQLPEPPESLPRLSRCSVTTYLGHFLIRPGRRAIFVRRLRQSFVLYLRSGAGFVVQPHLPLLPARRPERYYVLDTTVHYAYSERYFWWVTWPAAYPLVGYWPFQVKRGQLQVWVVLRLRDEAGRVRQKLVERVSDSRRMIFYGFYRSEAFENMIRRAYDRAFTGITRKLHRRAASICGAVPTGGVGKPGGAQ